MLIDTAKRRSLRIPGSDDADGSAGIEGARWDVSFGERLWQALSRLLSAQPKSTLLEWQDAGRPARKAA